MGSSDFELFETTMCYVIDNSIFEFFEVFFSKKTKKLKFKFLLKIF